jgi:MoxR-like ATPase
MAKAAAWVQGRDYVLPADVKLIYPATVAHRIILTPDAEAAGRKAEALVEEILKSVPAPVAK